MIGLLENVGMDGQQKSVKHSVGKTTENDRKRPKTTKNDHKTSSLRPYCVLTGCLLILPSNPTPRTFHLWRYKKGAWNIGHGEGANGEHEGHEDEMHMELDDKSQQITQISQIIVDKRKSSNETNETNNSCSSCNSLTIKETAEDAECAEKDSCSLCHPLATKKEIRCWNIN